jgi:pimeloyl-ACP methyl ester carboxylesterase
MPFARGERSLDLSTRGGHKIPALIRTVPESKATVIFAHGLAGDRCELDDILQRAAEGLSSLPVNSARFDFLGHGASTVSSEQMTLNGEYEDLSVIVDFFKELPNCPFIFVAASLGAVPTLLELAKNADLSIAALVFWNPVLDPFKTFVSPGTGWSQQSFRPFIEGLDSQVVSLNGFVVGRTLWNEFCDPKLSEVLWQTALRLPAKSLVFHGTADEVVPYSLSKEFSALGTNVTLRTFPGAKHGLVGFHDELIAETTQWIEDIVSR